MRLPARDVDRDERILPQRRFIEQTSLLLVNSEGRQLAWQGIALPCACKKAADDCQRPAGLKISLLD
jgi:hypothetical protein